MKSGRFITDPEAAVRAVFDAGVELTSQEVARLVGIGATTVREIRLGKKWPDVLPHIPRFNPSSCTGCLHFQPRHILATETEPDRCGICELGIPEARNVAYGRGCGAFVEAKK